jgi:uncharacterized protein
MTPEALSLLRKYYPEGSLSGSILIEHGEAIANKALAIAERLCLPEEDRVFILEVSLLHDIGIYLTNAPDLGCYGNYPYICHGYLGHDLLIKENLPKHALVCERHTGAGLTIEDMIKQSLPLPHRPMVPVTLVEKLIAYCDKFFSKDPGKLDREKKYSEIVMNLSRHGADKALIFESWHKLFNP